VVKRTGRPRCGAAAHGVEACVVKESRKRKGRGGGAWSREVGCERPRGKGVGRAETSRVRQLPNDGVVSARVRIDVGSWPRKNRGNPEGFRASKGALRVEKICLGYDLPVERY
jgi:hypothetical protein